MYTNDNVSHALTLTPRFPVRSGPVPVRARPAASSGLALAGTAVLLFSLSMVSTRLAAPELGGTFVGFGRGVVGALLGLVVIRLQDLPFPARRHWLTLAVVTAGSVIGFPVLSALAMARVPANHGLIFAALMPGLTAIAATVHGRLQPSVAGAPLSPRFWRWSVTGATVVVAYALLAGAGAPQLADGLLVVAMMCSAVGYSAGGGLSRELGGTAVLSWALVLGLPVTLPGLLVTTVLHPPDGSTLAWMGFLYTAIVSSFVGFLFWYGGMARGGVARIAQVQTVQPLLGLCWASLLLGEQVPWGAGLAAVGVIVCVRRALG